MSYIGKCVNKTDLLLNKLKPSRNIIVFIVSENVYVAYTLNEMKEIMTPVHNHRVETKENKLERFFYLPNGIRSDSSLSICFNNNVNTMKLVKSENKFHQYVNHALNYFENKNINDTDYFTRGTHLIFTLKEIQSSCKIYFNDSFFFIFEYKIYNNQNTNLEDLLLNNFSFLLKHKKIYSHKKGGIILKSEISEKALKSLQGIKEYVGDWKVLDVRVSQDVVVPMTDNWFVEVPKSPGRLSSAVVYVGSEEDKKAVGSVQLELGFFQKAYVSKRNITANEIIKEDDFELKNTEVLSKIAGNISTNFSMYNGKLAGNLKSRSFIKRGDVLMTSALAKPSAVLSGENVTLVLRGDNLRVTTKGTSQGNAAVGEMVSVQVRNYSKTFRGKVNEDKQVEVWL